MRPRAAQRLERGDPLQRLTARDIEDHRVPRGGRHRLRVLPQAATAEVGPGVLGRVLDGPVHGRVVGEPHHPAAGRQPVVQAAVGAHVGVLQVDELQPRVVPGQSVTGPVALEQLELGHPVELPRQQHRVLGQPVQHRLPPVQHVGGDVVDVVPVLVLGVLAGPVQVFHLELDPGHPPAVPQDDQMAAGRVVRDGPQLGDRRLQREVGVQELVLDHRQHQRRGAELEVGADLAHVRVADDHVQPAVLLRVGVRLVPGVDDGPLERGLQADLDLEEVGALADLEARAAAVGADADPAGAADHLPGDEERDQELDDVGKRRAAPHQVVLVRAVRGTLVVSVVLVQLDGRAARHGRGLGRGLRHHPLAGLVPDHHRKRVGALGRRILRVSVVDVQPSAVGEDDVGQAQILVGQLRGVCCLAGQVEPPRVPQRVLFLEVPAGPAGPGGGGRLVRVDDLGRGDHGVGSGLPRHRDAVLDLGTHHPPYAHARSSVLLADTRCGRA